MEWYTPTLCTLTNTTSTTCGSLVLTTCGVIVVKSVAATRLGLVCITCLPYPRFQVSSRHVHMYLSHAPAISQARNDYCTLPQGQIIIPYFARAAGVNLTQTSNVEGLVNLEATNHSNFRRTAMRDD